MTLINKKNLHTPKDLNLYTTIVENSEIQIAVADLNGKLLYVNRSWAQAHGYTQLELSGKSLKIFHPKEAIEEVNQFNKILLKEGKKQGEIVHCKKDGQRFVTWMNNFVVKIENKTKYLVGMATDITIEKNINEEFRLQSLILNQAQEVANLGSYVLYIDKNYYTSSPTLDKIFGIDKKYTRNFSTWAKIVHPLDRKMMVDYFTNNILGKHENFNKEYRIINHHTKEVRWVHGLGRLEYNGSLSPIRMLGTIQDITEQKIERMKLQESENKYRIVAEQSQDGIAIVSLGGEMRYVNPSLARLLKYDRDEIIGQNVLKFTHPDFHKSTMKVIDKFIHGTKQMRIEAALASKTGNRIEIEDSISAIEYQGEKCGLVIVRDISEKKNAISVIQQSELKFRKLFETAQDGILILDAKTGKIEDSNPYIEKITGYTKKDLLGLHLWEISPFKNETANKRKFLKLQKTEYVRYENLPLETKSGVKAYVEFVSNVYIDGHKSVIQCNIRDITARKATEDRLKENESQLQATLNSTNDGILTIHKNGKILNFNKRFQTLWKIPEKIIQTKDDGELLNFVLDQLKNAKAFLKKVKDLYNSNKTDLDIIEFKDGRIFERYSTPLLKDGDNIGRVWYFRNITEQRLNEQKVTLKTTDLEAMNRAMVGREIKMIELKNELTRLKLILKKYGK